MRQAVENIHRFFLRDSLSGRSFGLSKGKNSTDFFGFNRLKGKGKVQPVRGGCDARSSVGKHASRSLRTEPGEPQMQREAHSHREARMQPRKSFRNARKRLRPPGRNDKQTPGKPDPRPGRDSDPVESFEPLGTASRWDGLPRSQPNRLTGPAARSSWRNMATGSRQPQGACEGW